MKQRIDVSRRLWRRQLCVPTEFFILQVREVGFLMYIEASMSKRINLVCSSLGPFLCLELGWGKAKNFNGETQAVTHTHTNIGEDVQE